MRLSERLWSMRISLDDLTDDELATFDEAAALVRRVEEAPVADLKWDWFSANLAQGIIRIDKPSTERMEAVRKILNNVRVRIVEE